MLRANHASPYFNNKYEIRVIRHGLLAGFIPMNVAFGGYGAEHYLAAYVMARVPDIECTSEIPIIPGLRYYARELCCDKYTSTLRISRRRMTFNMRCVSCLDANYVEILLNPCEKLLAVRKTSCDTPNAVPWNSSPIPARELNDVLFQMMGWEIGWQCKAPANVLRRGNEQVLMFDLLHCEYRFRAENNNRGYIRAVPSSWADATGTDTIDFMLRSRRALANYLDDWRLAETASVVEGFDTYVQPQTQESIDLLIRELMTNEY